MPTTARSCARRPQRCPRPAMAEHARWTADDLPDLAEKTVVITGANSGIGYEAALALARRHATVVLACRDGRAAGASASRIAAAAPNARVEAMTLDLASLASASVRRRVPRPSPYAARPRQQRRRDGGPVSHHRRRLRDAPRHEPSRSLRA